MAKRTCAELTDRQALPDMVEAAGSGDREAWRWLVARYAPLVMAVASRYPLGPDDAADVHQAVWLKLVEHLRDIREPRALPGWIVTTTRNEALRMLQSRRRTVSVDPLCGLELHDQADEVSVDDEILRDEEHHALREGLCELQPRHRELLLLLLADPPLTYHDISVRLGIPIGSVGPTRARSLKALRNTAAMKTLLATSDLSPRR